MGGVFSKMGTVLCEVMYERCLLNWKVFCRGTTMLPPFVYVNDGCFGTIQLIQVWICFKLHPTCLCGGRWTYQKGYNPTRLPFQSISSVNLGSKSSLQLSRNQIMLIMWHLCHSLNNRVTISEKVKITCTATMSDICTTLMWVIIHRQEMFY